MHDNGGGDAKLTVIGTLAYTGKPGSRIVVSPVVEYVPVIEPALLVVPVRKSVDPTVKLLKSTLTLIFGGHWLCASVAASNDQTVTARIYIRYLVNTFQPRFSFASVPGLENVSFCFGFGFRSEKEENGARLSVRTRASDAARMTPTPAGRIPLRLRKLV